MKKTSHLIPLVLLGMWVPLSGQGSWPATMITFTVRKLRWIYRIRKYNLKPGGSWSLWTIW